MFEKYYKVLELKNDASDEEVKKLFNIDTTLRPSNLDEDTYFKIAENYEKKLNN